MTRQERLQYCIKCKNRKMDNARGLVCGLTNEYADFSLHCVDFVKDEKIIKKVEAKKDPIYSFEYEDLSIQKSIVSYSKMGWFLLVLLFGFGVNYYYRYILAFDFDNEDLRSFSSIIAMVFPFLTFLFIGIEFKRVKIGLLACIVYLIGSYILENMFNTMFKNGYLIYVFFTLASVIPPFLILSFRFFDDKKKQLWFVLKTTILYIGLNCILYGYLNLAEFMEYFSGIFSGDFRSSSFEHLNLLDLKITNNDGGYRLFPMKFIFGIMLISFLTYFLFISMYNQTVRNQKWYDLNVNLGSFLAKWKVAIIVILGYLGILMLATGIGSFIEDYTMMISYSANSNPETNLINYWVYISFVIQIVASFFALLMLAYHYRKFVLEYFLNHGIKVSWQYYFGFVPFIGIFVWMVNILTFKKTELPESKLSSIIKYSNIVFISLFLAFTLLYFISSSFNVSGLVSSVLVVLAGITLILLFVFHKNGVYVNAFARLLLFALLTYLFASEGNDFGFRFSRNYTKIISILLFVPIALQLLYHPIFHLRSYKVTLPKQQVEEFKTEISQED